VSLPLAGRRVVVTRPVEQAESLAELLREQGAEPVIVPLIEVIDVPAGMAQLAASDLRTFDWVVVTSPNVAERVERLHPAALGEIPPRIAAVGTATAAALSRCDLVPETQRAVGLLAAMPPAPPDGSGSVLVVQSAEAAPTLVDGLAAAGWRVTACQPVRAVPAALSAGQQLAALAADAVLFASGSAARAWVSVLGTTTPPIVVALGPQTGADVEAAGLKVSLVAADHSLAGLVMALVRHLAPLG
ncbi:unnamed protein product, partial [Phaeothamnion confervicola]